MSGIGSALRSEVETRAGLRAPDTAHRISAARCRPCQVGGRLRIPHSPTCAASCSQRVASSRTVAELLKLNSRGELLPGIVTRCAKPAEALIEAQEVRGFTDAEGENTSTDGVTTSVYGDKNASGVTTTCFWRLARD